MRQITKRIDPVESRKGYPLADSSTWREGGQKLSPAILHMTWKEIIPEHEPDQDELVFISPRMFLSMLRNPASRDPGLSHDRRQLSVL